MKMTTDLRRRLTDAIRNAPGMGLTVTSVVDAVMAVRDEEIAALRAEMERLKRDLTLATTRGDNWEAAYHHERKRADYAEAEVTRLRAGESPHPAPEHVNTTPAQRLESDPHVTITLTFRTEAPAAAVLESVVAAINRYAMPYALVATTLGTYDLDELEEP